MRRELGFLAIFIGVIVSFSGHVYAGTKIVITNSLGDVTAMGPIESDFSLVQEGMTLTEGYHLQTGETGQVDVVANRLWAYRVLPNTDIVFHQVSPQDMRMTLERGELWVRTAPVENETMRRMEIQTPRLTLKADGAEFWINENPSNVIRPGWIAVRSGNVKVSVESMGMELTLGAGDALDIPKSFSITSVRPVTEIETETLNSISTIPVFVLRANIAKELAILEKLGQMGEEKGASEPPSKASAESSGDTL